MPTTTNLGITYPASTAYVKDGATAMGTISTGIDTKIADSGFPNQLAYVSGGVARPVAFAMSTKSVAVAGTAVASGGFASATVTFSSSTRFTLAPAMWITLSAVPGGAGPNFVVPRIGATTTGGFTFYYYNVGAVAATWASMTADTLAIQLGSLNSYNN
jgi:hypothetical protein